MEVEVSLHTLLFYVEESWESTWKPLYPLVFDVEAGPRYELKSSFIYLRWIEVYLPPDSFYVEKTRPQNKDCFTPSLLRWK